MGMRRRQLREELERREKGVAAEGSGGLGAGGEARVAAAQLDELKKRGEALREQQSRARSAAWDTARASASKKRRASSGAAESWSAARGNGDDDLEERTVRVKWSIKKESHSDHTLDVLFSRLGAVESVTIEAGTGNKALVTFGSAPSADAAVAAYRDSETMRASYVGKRRPKRSAFATRRHTMTPTPQQRHGSAAASVGGWTAGAGDTTINSFRDQESLVMMKLRQEAERQALIRKMAQEDGVSVAGNGAGSGAIPVTPKRDVKEQAGGGGGGGAAGDGTGEPGVTSAAKSARVTISEGGGGDAGVTVQPADAARGQNGAEQDEGAGGRERKNSGEVLSGRVFGVGGNSTPFSVPSPSTGRESAILAAMMNGGVAGRKMVFPTGTAGGSKSVPATPVSVREGCSRVGVVDEGDVLARMMAMKR